MAVKNNKSVGIFIVDDELSVRDSLTKWFKEFNYRVDSAGDATETLKKIKPGKWDIAFLDIKLPGMDGTELNRKIKEIDPEIKTIMITAHSSVESAVKSLKDGAYDYVTKPVDPDYLIHLVEKIMKQKELVSENARLKDRIQDFYEHDQIPCQSPAMERVYDLIEAVAPTDTTVMIRGESGTGKELLARSIHSASPRRYFPIITINCGGLTPGLTESEFFGHEKGAFTGALYRRMGKLEMANQGTIFLDEVGCLDAKTQTDLLRVIESKQFTRVGGDKEISVDFRLICATNRNLEQAVENGEFREDLYYRLNVFAVNVPPLRERRPDILLLAKHMLKKFTIGMNKKLIRFSPEAIELLENHAWAGNVRELRNCVERAVVVAVGEEVSAESLPIISNSRHQPQDKSLSAFEKSHIQSILDEAGGNIMQAANALGIDRTTLYNKIEKYGLRR